MGVEGVCVGRGLIAGTVHYSRRHSCACGSRSLFYFRVSWHTNKDVPVIFRRYPLSMVFAP